MNTHAFTELQSHRRAIMSGGLLDVHSADFKERLADMLWMSHEDIYSMTVEGDNEYEHMQLVLCAAKVLDNVPTENIDQASNIFDFQEAILKEYAKLREEFQLHAERFAEEFIDESDDED